MLYYLIKYNIVTLEFIYNAYEIKLRYCGQQPAIPVTGHIPVSAAKSRSCHAPGNGRLYDPVVGRFLSPDNYVQMPGFTQGYNRYSYCWNNPLIYTDPSGESILGFGGDFIVGFVKGFFSNKGTGRTMFGNAFHRGWHEAVNGVKIDAGLFAWDQHYSGKGDVWRDMWQVVSRFTWELPQTIVGYTGSHFTNNFGHVNEVNYYGGATVVQRNKDAGGITLGSYIIGGRDIRAEATNELFQHEYGHYLQSRLSGWYYFSKYGIPSLLSKGDYFDHGNHPAEQDANVLALSYFMKYEDGFTLADWNFNRASGGHPIIGFNSTLPYDDPINQAALRDGRLRLEWFDFLLGPNILVPGIINALVLNSRF